jgi:hypothetical protein
VIGVHVCVDDVRDLHALASGEGLVRIDVVKVRVDHDTLAETAAAE